MSIGDLAEEMSRIADSLPTTALLRAADSLGQAVERLAHCAQGTASHELSEAVRQLATEQQRITEILQAVHSAQQAIRRYCEQITAPDLAAASPTSAKKDDSPPASRDALATNILRRLPVRTPANPKTSGYWIDDHGNERGPLISGRDDDYQTAVEVLRELRLSPGRGTLFVTEHVEVKFAVNMRRGSARRATLVINNTPCSPGRYSCDKLMPQILRPDQEVTVYWPGGKKTYVGRRP